MRLPSVEESREIFSPSSVPGIVDHLLERGQPRLQHVLDLVAARGHHVGDVVGAGAQRFSHLVAARNKVFGDPAAGLFDLLCDVAAPQIKVEDDGLAGGLER